MRDRKKIAKALRKLVGAIYKDCAGAYGIDHYEGQYEKEIRELTETLIQADNEDINK